MAHGGVIFKKLDSQDPPPLASRATSFFCSEKGWCSVGLSLQGLWTVENRAFPASAAGPALRLSGALHSVFSMALSVHLPSFLRTFLKN